MWKKCVLGFAMSALLIAGCSKDGEKESEEKAKDDKVFTIVMENKDNFDMKEISEELSKKYGVPVDVKKVTAAEKRDMIMQGKADVALLNQQEIGFAKDENLIQKVSIKKDTYLKSAVEGLKYNGVQYAIPATFDVPVYVYNPTVIKEVPKTMSDLKKFAETEKQKSDVRFTTRKTGEEVTTEKTVERQVVKPPYATYLNLNEYNSIEPFLASYGYKPFETKKGVYQTSSVHLTGKTVETGFEKIKELTKDVLPTDDLSNSKVAEMYNEKQLYSFVGTKSQIDKIENEKAYSTIPEIEKGKVYEPTIEVEGWAVMEHFNDKKIIEDFEKMVSDETYVKEQEKENGVMVPVKKTWEEEDKLTNVIYEQALKSRALPILAEAREIDTPVERALQWYIQDINDLYTALKNAKQTTEFEISSNF